MSAVNKVRYQQFVRRARGANIGEIRVNRVDKKSAVYLKYNGKPPKGRGRLTGEWTVSRDEKSDEQIEEEIKAFLSRARKDFFVRRGDGLGGTAYADAAQEAEAVPQKAAEKAD